MGAELVSSGAKTCITTLQTYMLEDQLKKGKINEKAIKSINKELEGLKNDNQLKTLELSKNVIKNILADTLKNGVSLKGKNNIEQFIKLNKKVHGLDINIDTSNLNEDETYTLKFENNKFILFTGSVFPTNGSKFDNPLDNNKFQYSKYEKNIINMKNSESREHPSVPEKKKKELKKSIIKILGLNNESDYDIVLKKIWKEFNIKEDYEIYRMDNLLNTIIYLKDKKAIKFNEILSEIKISQLLKISFEKINDKISKIKSFIEKEYKKFDVTEGVVLDLDKRASYVLLDTEYIETENSSNYVDYYGAVLPTINFYNNYSLLNSLIEAKKDYPEYFDLIINNDIEGFEKKVKEETEKNRKEGKSTPTIY